MRIIGRSKATGAAAGWVRMGVMLAWSRRGRASRSGRTHWSMGKAFAAEAANGVTASSGAGGEVRYGGVTLAFGLVGVYDRGPNVASGGGRRYATAAGAGERLGMGVCGVKVLMGQRRVTTARRLRRRRLILAALYWRTGVMGLGAWRRLCMGDRMCSRLAKGGKRLTVDRHGVTNDMCRSGGVAEG